MDDRISFVKNSNACCRMFIALVGALLLLPSAPTQAIQSTNDTVDLVMTEDALAYATVTASMPGVGGTNHVYEFDVEGFPIDDTQQKSSGLPVVTYQTLKVGDSFVDKSGDAQASEVVADTRTSATDPLVFSRLASKMSFSADINDAVAVEMVRDGVASRSAVAGLQYVDTDSGQTQLISWVKSSSAVAIDEGVLYEDAFVGAVADVRYVISPSRLQQDVILYALPDPEILGLNPDTTRVRVLTEIMDVSTSDLQVLREFDISQNEASAAPMQVFRGTERLLNLQRGYAYAQEDGWAIGGREGEPWHILDLRIVEMNNRIFLAEEIPLAVIRSATPEIFVRDGWSIPDEETVSVPPVRPVSSSAPEVAGSFTRPHRGFVIDYIHWYATITNAVTLETGQTYLITNSLAFDGTNAVLTIKPGAVVKFGTNGYISMQNGARIVSRSHLLNPAVFTSADDSEFGEIIPGYTNAPADRRYETAFELATAGNILEGIRVRYARKALSVAMTGQTIRHSILEKGPLGFDITTASTGGTVTLRNILFSSLNRGVVAGSTSSNIAVQLLNSTMDSIAEYAVATNNGVSVFTIECSLFAFVTNQILKSNPTIGYSVSSNGVYQSATQGLGAVIIVTNQPFKTGLAGNHYLDQSLPLINRGYNSAANWQLYHYTTATNHQKESNTVVDIGFHYPTPIDTDGDGLYDYQEDINGNNIYDAGDWTDLTNPDTDGDGLTDGDEVNVYGTNPLMTDTDGDGSSDRAEVDGGTDPLNPLSFLTTISGNITHTGSQTGLIHITARTDTGLVVYLTFDQNTGTNIVDHSGHTNNGSAYGGAAWTTNGYRGGAFYFDGTNDYLRIPFSPSYNRTQFTASAWVKLNETNVTVDARGVFGRHKAGVNTHSWWSFADGAGIRGQLWGSSGSSGMITTNLTSIAQRWGFVTLTYDGSQLKFYTNAILVKSLTVANYAGNLLDLLVGAGEYTSAGGNPDRFWFGWIDDVRLHDRALNTNEIKNLITLGTTLTNAYRASIATPGAYTITNVPNRRMYAVDAWRDPLGNLVAHPSFAAGNYTGNSFYVSSPVANIDVTLTEPDSDGDGLSDFDEIYVYDTDPHDSASYITTISGNVSYSGFQTGLIHVVASYYPHQTLYLSFDQNNGTNIIDQSGYTNNGSAYDGATWTTNGYRGGAFYFDGTNDYLRIPFSPSYNRTQFTASAWVKLNETNVTVDARGIFGRHTAGVNTHSWWSFADGAGLRGQLWGTSGSSGMITTNLASIAQQWGFVTLTYDGSQLKFYTNATLIKSLPVSNYAGNTLDLLVGAGEYANIGEEEDYFVPDRFWHGWIDEVQMHRKALTGAEITNLFLTGSPRNLSVTITNPGPYTITGVPTKHNYFVEAWRDSNANATADPPEAQGVYSNNLVTVNAAVSNVHIILTDLDSDNDGLPDWWEWQYGLNANDNGATNRHHGALGDLDYDGFLNIYEFIHLTAPNDADSVPESGIIVDADATDEGDGNPESPFKTIQAAINAAGDYDIIRLRPGLYKGEGNANISLQGKPIMLHGETEAVLDAEYIHPYGVRLVDGEDPRTVLSGMTIRNGLQAGIYSSRSSATIQGCTVTKNLGYGMYLFGSNVWVRQCRVVDNILAGDWFFLNSGISIDGHRGIIENSIVANNYTRSVCDTNAWFVWWEFGWWLGPSGISIWGDQVEVNNCTIVDNDGMGIDSSWAIYPGPKVRNCIIWGNTASIMTDYADVQYSCFQDAISVSGNISGNPQLVPGNFRLKSSSPCIDTGTASYAPSYDMIRSTRWDHPQVSNVVSTVDMGAFELVDVNTNGMDDVWGQEMGVNVASSDPDSDGLTNLQEYEFGTHPQQSDTDGDGLSDYDEIYVHGTNPRQADTDGDGIPDGWEIAHGLNPLDHMDALIDSDGDGYVNAFEFYYATDPLDEESAPDAVVVRVNPFAFPGGDGSPQQPFRYIQDAVNAALDYSVVLLEDGVYRGAGNRNITLGGKSILLTSTGGASRAVVDCEYQSPGFFLNGSDTEHIILRGITIKRSALGALRINRGRPLIERLVMAKGISTGGYGSAVDVEALAEPIVSHCTIFGNRGGIAAVRGVGKLKAKNCILWGNIPASLYGIECGITFSCIQGGFAGTGNINIDPLYIPTTGHLKSSSPCIDAGVSLSVSVDMDNEGPWDHPGHSNVVSIVDIGADEFVDSDGDGMPDWWEIMNGLDPNDPDDALEDANGDGRANLEEYEDGTEPIAMNSSQDSDGDGIPDWWELQQGLDPDDPDDALLESHEDGITNLLRYQKGISVNNPKAGAILREETRAEIVGYWRLQYQQPPVFTNLPGSAEDLTDMADALEQLSGKFFKNKMNP